MREWAGTCVQVWVEIGLFVRVWRGRVEMKMWVKERSGDWDGNGGRMWGHRALQRISGDTI